MSRTTLFKIAASILAAPFVFAAPHAAAAEDYPARAVTLIIPYPAGGGVDTVGRIIAQKLTAALGQQVIVENRPGAGSVIGTRAAVKAPAGRLHAPDDHHRPEPVGEPGLRRRQGFRADRHDRLDPDRGDGQSFGAGEIAVRRDRAGEKGAGQGHDRHARRRRRSNYFGAEQFKALTGIDVTIVTYKGTGPLTNDLVGGHVMLAFNTLPPAIGNIQAGKLSAIAVAAPERLAAIPDVPTAAEAGLPGLDVVLYYGLAAPAGTPRPIIERLNKELRAIVTSDDFKKRIDRRRRRPGPPARRRNTPPTSPARKASGAA